MTTSFNSARATARFDWVYRDVLNVGDRGYCDYDDYVRIAQEFTDGDGDEEVNGLWVANRTLTLASPTDALDLSGGIEDKYGNALTFENIKLLLIHNLGMVGVDGTPTPTHGQDLLVGGAGSNPWLSPFNGLPAGVLLLRSGGFLILCAPYDGYNVTGGSEDVLQIAHAGSAASGGDIEYDIAIAGVG